MILISDAVLLTDKFCEVIQHKMGGSLLSDVDGLIYRLQDSKESMKKLLTKHGKDSTIRQHLCVTCPLSPAAQKSLEDAGIIIGDHDDLSGVWQAPIKMMAERLQLRPYLPRT
ncbi:hypothetical protein HK104_002425 [Borealophlyctis nickersoniae]|nr:hypothetical protein HK104_002425 [Borealophlyctis nickersoniae]